MNSPEPLNITVWMPQSFTQNFDSIILQVIVPKVQAPQVWVVQNSRSQVQTRGTSENTTHQPVKNTKEERETFSCEAEFTPGRDSQIFVPFFWPFSICYPGCTQEGLTLPVETDGFLKKKIKLLSPTNRSSSIKLAK